MGLESYSEDQLDQLLVRAEQEIGSWRALEMAVVAEKKHRRSFHADGHRSVVDWFAARADVSHQTARSVCWTSTRLGEAPEVAESLVAGEVTFDRAEQLARLPETERGDHEGLDIGQLRRRVAHHRRLSPKRERWAVANGFLNFGPDVDDLMTNLWGALPGLDARLVEKAVDQRADEIIASDSGLGVARRRALALVAICQDSLYTDTRSEAAPIDVAVTVDASIAARTNGESGIAILDGPRIGRLAIEEILCNGVVEVYGVSERGKPLNLGRRHRTVSRKLRRYVLTRDGGCTVDSCPSRYRLEVHHVLPWSRRGKTNAENLITLCWYHHHIAVHREGLEVHRLGTSRVRLKRPR